MRIVLQRVSRAEVRVEGRALASVGRGLVALVAVEKGDTEASAERAAAKIAGLRIFPGEDGAKMDRSVTDVAGEVLVVSQFTLAGSVRKGRRPSFDRAAPPSEAEPLCESLAGRLRSAGLRVSTGRFGARMEVDLVNDGPVTIWLETGADGEFGP